MKKKAGIFDVLFHYIHFITSLYRRYEGSMIYYVLWCCNHWISICMRWNNAANKLKQITANHVCRTQNGDGATISLNQKADNIERRMKKLFEILLQLIYCLSPGKPFQSHHKKLALASITQSSFFFFFFWQVCRQWCIILINFHDNLQSNQIHRKIVKFFCFSCQSFLNTFHRCIWIKR